MADSPKGADSPAEAAESYFPISLTDLDLSNVVGGVSVHQVPTDLKLPQVASTIMCCW